MSGLLEKIQSLLAARRDREEAHRLAKAADLWLEDETLNTALAIVRKKAFDTWSSSADVEVQRECWRALQSVNAFVSALRMLQVQGKVEDAEAKRALAKHPPKE